MCVMLYTLHAVSIGLFTTYLGMYAVRCNREGVPTPCTRGGLKNETHLAAPVAAAETCMRASDCAALENRTEPSYAQLVSQLYILC